MSGDPKRWLDPEGGGPPELVELLRVAEPPSHLEASALDELVRRTQASLSTSPPPAGSTPWWKGLLGVGGVALGVAAWMFASSPEGRDAPAPARLEVAPRETHDRGEPVEDTRHLGPAPGNAAGLASFEPAPPTREARPLLRSSTRVSEAYPEDTLAAEAASLESIRRALDAGEAEDAIRQLRRHRRIFRLGQLLVERDRLEIEALVRAGRVNEARRRGAVFLRRHGGSVYASRVTALLEGLEP